MATIGVMRTWHSAGSQYIYWNVSQIANPLADYPGGGGYPATNLLSDFVLLDYDLNSDGYANNDGIDIYLPWGAGVEDGYAVYATHTLGVEECLPANPLFYATSAVIGIATTDTDYVRVGGTILAYCSGTANPGDPLYLSAIEANGTLTATAPRTQNVVYCFVGTALDSKTGAGVGLVSINVDPRQPLLLEQNIDI